MKKSLLLLIMLFAPLAAAAQQNCVCNSGCKIASDPYSPGTNQPTSCSAYKPGSPDVLLGSAATALSSTIVGMPNVCQPANGAYNPGVAGSVSCLVAIPPQTAGTLVTVVERAANAAGETANSAQFTFQSVSALATLPSVPLNLRVQ
jgi:hypothetical protein